MPRYSRKNQKSYTGIYHIILRGINSQEVFLDDMDRKKFMKGIRETKEKYKYELYAYALMNNHIHLLIKDTNDSISKMVQSLAIKYALYFNKKYERIGHVFYNRFNSKCVENEPYLLNVHRYIHKNPQKDGICKMSQYEWSSYQEYITNKEDITNIDFILSVLSEDRDKAVELWKKHHQESTGNEYNEETEFELKQKLTDDEAIHEIKRKLQINNIFEIQKYGTKYKEEIIKKLATIEGIGNKQLARITGMSRRTIQRMISGR